MKKIILLVSFGVFIIVTLADVLLNTSVPLSIGELFFSIITGITVSISVLLVMLVIVYLYKKVTL